MTSNIKHDIEFRRLGPIYTERQYQPRVNAGMMLGNTGPIEIKGVTSEWVEMERLYLFQLFSMTNELLLLTGSMLTLGINGPRKSLRHRVFITARILRMGKVIVSVCQFIPGGGEEEGGTPSPSHNTSTGPMSFPGVPHWLVPGPFRGGMPGWGTPQPGMGYPPGQEWGTPLPGIE